MEVCVCNNTKKYANWTCIIAEGRLQLQLVVPSLSSLEQELHLGIQHGGQWSPPDCIPRQRLALIVPYKDRVSHLRVFLNHYHRVLQQQKIQYRIFVTEQVCC